MKTKILSILALLLMTVTQGAWAQETLTVYDGTDESRNIPMWCYNFNEYTKSECIIPASELTAMKGGTITAITFYAKTVSGYGSTFGSANQKVFLKEVSGTTLGSSFSGTTDATDVFSGSLPIPTTSGGYTITFSQGYTYNGGNLLIGVYNDAKGIEQFVTWYGIDNQSKGVSACGSDDSSLANIDYYALSFLPKTTFTYTPAPTAVDLGLPSGKKWANRNVGATSETGYGTYFAWAATASQADYSQANAPYYSGSAYTKYTGSDYTMLQRGDDAATVNWGSNWRMPTDTELQELIDNTTKEWKTNYNGTGVNGYLVTSKTNGNSIFLPAAGWYYGTELRSASQGGNYWMSTVVTSDVRCGYSLNFYSTGYAPYKDNTDTRYVGFSVRPVQMFAGEGTEASPYLISSTTDWDNLVSAVNAGETYSGNYFKMTANVGTVSTWMTGDLTTTGIFSGHFDGGGHTLTVNYSSDTQYCHPFGFLRGATIENLHVTGNITTSQTYAAGLAGRALSNSTNYITNCLVSTNITSTRSGTANICGVVMSVQADATLYIEGCAFTGSITSNGTDNGGFSEWVTAGGVFSATNCLFAPSSVTDNSLVNSKTFCRNGGSFSGCYFTRTLGTAQGLQARSIAKGANVTTLAISGAGTEYDVSGITAYAHGIDFNDGSTTTFYGGSGQTVSLALTHETRDGYQFKQYVASQGTLSDETTDTPTLTMPAANSTANDVVTISAQYDPLYNATFADGNDNDGWTIDPEQQIAGGTVTVRYEGENKVKSVTVTKLALCSLSEVTNEHVGKIIGADGNVYASLAQAVKVTSAVGVLGKVTETGHGLIMSLEDAPQQVWATIDGWASASYAGTTLKVLPDDDARGSNLPSYTTLGSTTVSNWAVATRADYTAIFTNLGSTGGDNDGISYDANMNAKITGAGGTAISGGNWSSTQYDSSKAWRFDSTWGGRSKTDQYKVRPVLGF